MKNKKYYMFWSLILVWVYVLNYFYTWIDYDIDITPTEIVQTSSYENYLELTQKYNEDFKEITSKFPKEWPIVYWLPDEMKLTPHYKELIYDDLVKIFDKLSLIKFDFETNFYVDENYITNYDLKKILKLSEVLIMWEKDKSIDNSVKYFKFLINYEKFLKANWIRSLTSSKYLTWIYEKLKPNLSQEQVSELDDLLNYEVNKEIAFDLYLKKLRNEYIKMIDDESYNMPFSNSKEVAYFYINYLDNYIKAWNYDIINEKPRVYKIFLHKTNFYNQRVVDDINIWVKKFLKAEY